MRNIWVIATIIFALNNQGYSQSLEVNWGELQTNNETVHKIIPSNGSSYYLIKNIGREQYNAADLWLDYYASTANTPQQSNKLQLPEINNYPAKFEELFCVEDKLILLASVENIDSLTRELYIQHLNNEGAIIENPKYVGRIPLENDSEDGFQITLSTDKKKILVCYYPSFVEYHGQPFRCKIYDTNLKRTFSKKLKLPLFGKQKITFKHYILDDKDNIFISCTALQETKKKVARGVVEDKFDHFVMVYNQRYKTTKIQSVTLKKSPIVDINIIIDQEGNLTAFGFMALRNQKNIAGVFYQKYNPIDLSPIFPLNSRTNFKLFANEQLATFTDKRNSKSGEYAFNYRLKNIEMLSNGSIIIAAEHQYSLFSKGRRMYRHNDVILAMGNSTGKIEWVKRLLKTQTAYATQNLTSYTLINDHTRIKILYNDNPANLKLTKLADSKKIKPVIFDAEKPSKAIPVVVSLYTDGTMRKDPAFQEEGVLICPKLGGKIKDAHIIYGHLSEGYKLGKFRFD